MATSTHSAQLEELLAVYALGALDGDDLRACEDHLAASCAACERLLARWKGDLETLATELPPIEPAATTRARLLRQVAAGQPAAPRDSSLGWGGWTGWLVAAGLLLTCGWGWRELDLLRTRTQTLEIERRSLRAGVEDLRQDLTAARLRNERLEQAMAVLGAPGLRPIALAGLKDAPDAKGHTFLDPATGKALFFAARLPALAADKTYELWFIADGKPVAAGTFGVDAKGGSRVAIDHVPAVEHIQAWAVTIEPAGGMPQPTGPMVLKG